MKQISILGSTGSIGTNTLEVVEKFPQQFRVRALACGRNISLFSRQIQIFKPDIAVVLNDDLRNTLIKDLPSAIPTIILCGEDGYIAAATYDKVEMVVSSMVGAAGLIPTVAAIKAGKDIALANKETLVMAGQYVMDLAQQQGVHIYPIDSEHSAIFQCLVGHDQKNLKKIILTASGGPFLNTPLKAFPHLQATDALKHPTWKMGSKISIDSSTLMNKGLEIIEAMHLFNLPLNQIEVIIHPQSMIHSLVAFTDGSMIAQLSLPDMRGAISYALSFPERLNLDLPSINLSEIASFSFFEPDRKKFPCLNLAIEAGKAGGSLPAVLNAANEIVVDFFLRGKIKFTMIPETIEKTMACHNLIEKPDLASILEADQWARNKTKEILYQSH